MGNIKVEVVTDQGMREFQFASHPGYVVLHAYDVLGDSSGRFCYRLSSNVIEGQVYSVNFRFSKVLSMQEILDRVIGPGKAAIEAKLNG